MMDVVISLAPTSMVICSKVNSQINLEYLMFNISYLSKLWGQGRIFFFKNLNARIDVFYEIEQ